jgi:predicted nucleic acid-binding protein
VITLDASVVIAHLNPTDRHHEEAAWFFRESEDEDFVMHSVNLAEVLVGGVRAGRGEEMLADLEAMGIHVASPGEGEPLRLANLRVSASLKLPDCCALDAALTIASALATVDDGLATAARWRELAVVPARRAQTAEA